MDAALLHSSSSPAARGRYRGAARRTPHRWAPMITASRSPYPLASASVGSVHFLHPKWPTKCSTGSGTVVVVPHRELEERRRRLSRAFHHRRHCSKHAVHVLVWLLLPSTSTSTSATRVPVLVGLRRRHPCPPFVPSQQLKRLCLPCHPLHLVVPSQQLPRPCLPVGDPFVEVTEESRDASYEAKGMAME